MRILLKCLPDNPTILAQLGATELLLGNHDEADRVFQLSLNIVSDQPIILFRRGIALENLGRDEEALKCYNQAIFLHPDFHEALVCRDQLAQQSRSEAGHPAEKSSRSAEQKSNLAESYYKEGQKLYEARKLDEALASFNRAIEQSRDYADAYNSRGVILQELNRLDEALESGCRAISIKPDFMEAHYNCGIVLGDLNRLDEALKSFDRAIALKPDFPNAHSSRGVVLGRLRRFDEELASYDRTIALQPDYPNVHNNRRVVLGNLNRLGEALACCDDAIVLNPDDADAYFNRGNILKDLGRLEEALASLDRAIILKPDFEAAYSRRLFVMNFHSRYDPAEYQGWARRYCTLVTERAKAYMQWRVGAEGDNGQRLKVGLVSGDFRSHPVGFFIEGIVAQLDAKRVELVAYSTVENEDALTARIKPYFEVWNVIAGVSDEAVAKKIHADGIHILVDLAGHTANNRLPVFAWKPAPVQASWLGYCASTGVSAIDYFIADIGTLPQPLESQFTETIWRLAESYLCLTPPVVDVEVTEPPALTAGYVTFASFNNFPKMNEEVVALWARILKAIPSSRLFLKTHQFGEDSVRGRVVAQYAAHGISADRLLLEGHILDQSIHMRAYSRVDIGLDPFPYNGVTTTFEALWMGVPVLTLAGGRFISRQGVGILTNAGLSDWIAADADELVAKAVAYAGNLDRLAVLRAGLRRQVQASPLFDAARFARHLEDALFGMWRQRMASGKHVA